MPNCKVDWVKIKSEYVTSTCSMPELAEKYGVSISSVRKRAAKEKWNDKRLAANEKQAEIIEKQLTEKKAKQVVSDIEKVVRVANKLLAKINKAANELDKSEYVKNKNQHVVLSVTENGDRTTTDKTTQTKLEFERFKTLIDTKKLSNLTKSLVDVKEILTSFNNENEEDTHGIIEIPAMGELSLPKELTDGEQKNE